MWWDPSISKNGQSSDKQIPPARIRNYMSVVETSSFLNERATQNINQEVARCISLISAENLPDSSSVWLTQGSDPATGRALVPLLNEEARIASGADIRSSSLGAGASVVQVNNTFTTIQSKGICHNGAISGGNPIVKSELTCKQRKKVEGKLKSTISKNSARTPFIPLYPDCLGSALSHWIQSSVHEGVHKALVSFSKSDRMLLWMEMEEYEEKFGNLKGPFSATKILKVSSKYLNDMYRDDSGLKNLFSPMRMSKPTLPKDLMDPDPIAAEAAGIVRAPSASSTASRYSLPARMYQAVLAGMCIDPESADFSSTRDRNKDPISAALKLILMRC
eukprot:IDg23541t1